MTLPATVPCPICRKPVPAVVEQWPASFPFCCERCRLIDLGRWADGAYAVAGELPEDGEADAVGRP